jgi:protein phosphatase 1 regulatory subunit 7
MSTPADTPVADQAVTSGAGEVATTSSNGLQSNKSGWDGKLRLDKNKKAVLANPEALSDPDYSDEDAPPVDQIEADEGISLVPVRICLLPILTCLARLARRRRSRN